MIEWNFVNVSVIGSSHSKMGLPCQDTCKCFIINNQAPIFIAVAADGAGSAQYADLGSKFACNIFIEKLIVFFQSGNSIENLKREYIENLIQEIKVNISEYASSYNSNPREFACTIITAIIGLNSAVFFQIGDGAIVVSSSEDNGSFNWVFWPQNGEYINTTFFLTDENTINNLNFDSVNKKIEKIAIFTDGLQTMALNYQSKVVHQPFFQKCFEIIKNHETQSIDERNEQFSNILSSNIFNERTDDDKTLILAERRSYLEDADENLR